MVWKKDLEKLKRSLGAEELNNPPKPVPKPKPKPAEAQPMEDEDRMFLSAMGHRPRPAATPSVPAAAAPDPAEASQPARGVRPLPAQASQPLRLPQDTRPGEGPDLASWPLPPEENPGAEFSSAMGGLKGIVALRSLEPGQLAKAPAPLPRPSRPQPAVEVPPPAAPPKEEAPVQVEPPPEEPAPAQAVQINLAAGMAIDVDAALDLKGHGRNDAEERLKERILDAQVLAWRSLHVILGPSEDLRQMLLDILKSPSGTRIARFAQAPIPMGGSQAWILYFKASPPSAD